MLTTLINPLGYYANFKTYYQGNHQLLFTNLSLDLILTMELLEHFNYNASLTTTGAIRGTSKEKFYQELGFEPLQHRRWFRKLCTFYKIFKNQSLHYIYELLPIKTTPHNTRSFINLPFFMLDTLFSKIHFFFLQ